VTRFASRHHAVFAPALEPDETLLAAERVVINAAVANETERGNRGNRGKRVEAARALGFGVPGPIFVIAMTDRRLLFFTSSAWLGHPRSPSSEIPLDEIATIRAVRRWRAERLAILLESRSMLVVQPLWRRGLHHFDRAFAEVTGG
jgi:hypothetical protein